MRPPPDILAIALLTVNVPSSQAGVVKPLTPREWGRFAAWLRQKPLAPRQLLDGKPTDLLEGWRDKTVSIERVKALLDRSAALSRAIDSWTESGLWMLASPESGYPHRLKQHLPDAVPAVLFGCGRKSLLNDGGLAVVGSRNIGPADAAYSRRLGELASEAGVSVVSGGARGVDEEAMLGALESGGTVVGVLANGLLRAAASKKYRQHIKDGNLALVSHRNPEAGFNVGHAMQRNKYVYCLAEAAFVVHSGKTGGTWNGAQENLAKRWVPLWVKPAADPEAGNADLIRAGAGEAPAEADQIDVAQLLSIGRMENAKEATQQSALPFVTNFQA